MHENTQVDDITRDGLARRDAQEAHAAPQHSGARKSRVAQMIALFAFCLFCCLAVALNSRAASTSNAASSDPAPSGATPGAQQQTESQPKPLPGQEFIGDYSKFPHTNPTHSRLPCLLCHRRENNSIVPVRSLGHTPCSGCHAQQFANPQSPICTICHTDPSSSKPAVKPFPGLHTFRMRFDHATHSRAATSCALCHKPAGRASVGLSIPAGFKAHATCFTCHEPRATASDGRDISSCGTCHRIGGYSRTPATARAYSTTPFNHAAHTRKGLSCAECHEVRAGATQGRQMSAPTPLMHHAPAGTKSCATCHDNKRAFGGDDFTDCKRCHTGNQWRF